MPKKINEDLKKLIIERYITDENITSRKLSKEYGVDYSTICKWIKDLGIRKFRNHYDEERLKECGERFINREKVKTLADEYGFPSQVALKRAMERRGYKRKRIRDVNFEPKIIDPVIVTIPDYTYYVPHNCKSKTVVYGGKKWKDITESVTG